MARPGAGHFEQASRFVDYYRTVRGVIREEIVRIDLLPYIRGTSLRIIDVGGGTGRDALWLAKQGHTVVVVEPSAMMFEKAKANIKDVSPEEQQRVTLVSARLEQVYQQYVTQPFDLVLSHGVLMYENEDPEGHVRKLTQLAKPGGFISVLTNGYGGAILQLIGEGRTADAILLQQSKQHVNKYDETVWAFSPDDLRDMLGRSGAEVKEWAGVRVLYEQDTRNIQDVTSSEMISIIELEERFGRDLSTKGMGHMLHFIAQKRQAPENQTVVKS
jgi:S-adenosylmethionine-dependent methyltransferase